MAYITTPIYYVNDDPHIGHMYTTISADVLARFFRLTGHPAYLLTGTDEHSAKVVDSAKLHGMITADWAEKKACVFASAFKNYGIQLTDFIRTSEFRHVRQVQKRIKNLLDSGDIYLGNYEGWYDIGQEEYVPELRAKSNGYLSAINKKPLVRRHETCFYFRLSKYADDVKNLITNDILKIRPVSRQQEILARIRDGINDIPCSRPRIEDWGIAVPGHEDQIVYVWIDALLNYLTAVDSDDKRAFWPPKIQIIGKDILWFHALIWPAMLLALQKSLNEENKWIALPEIIRAHGFWIRNGEKMSKSMSNFISLPVLNAYSEIYGYDAIRFFLISTGPNEGSDADFSEDRLYETYTSLLANTFGNCCSRVIVMIAKYCEAKIPAHKIESGFPIIQVMESIKTAVSLAIESEFPILITEAFKIVRLTDAFLQNRAPFQLIKNKSSFPEVCAILYDSLEALRLASMLLWPIMPESMQKFWSAISFDKQMLELINGGLAEPKKILHWGQLSVGASVSKSITLFPRIERSTVNS